MPQTTPRHALDRYLPASGILAVVFFVGGIVFESTGPAPSDSPTQLVTKFASDRAGVLIGSYLLIVGIALFAIFLSVLRSSLHEAEGEPGTLSTMTLGSGLAGLALSTSYVAIYGSLAHGVASGGGASLLFALFAVSNALDSVAGVFFSLAALAAGVVILRTSTIPKWLGWLGVVSGGLGFFGTFALDRPDSSIGFVGFVGSVLFLFWMLFMSVVLLRRALARRTRLPVE